MDIYAILILLSLCALVAITGVFVQKINARYRNIEDDAAYIKNALEKLSAQVDFYGANGPKPAPQSLSAPDDFGEIARGIRLENERRDADIIENLSEARKVILDKLAETREALLQTMGDVYAAQPARSVPEDADIVSKVEMTLRQIQDIAQEMKDSAPLPVGADDMNDARMWTLVNSLRSDATEAREALERSQKRLRQLGDAMEDAMRKLRALDRRIKQAKRQERVQALPAPDLDDDMSDMKL